MVAAHPASLRHCRRPPSGGWRVTRAHVAQLAEHFLGKEEVSGSSPDVGSSTGRTRQSNGEAAWRLIGRWI